MLSSLFENIKALTLKANESVEENNIEQCNITLVKRQNLLEKLSEQVSLLSENDPSLNNKFIELILWIQEQDKPNIVNLQAKKQENIQKSIKQVKSKKAMQQYKTVR